MTEYFSDSPLFVIGIWRSGTSLLYSLLNQHPDIALLYEGDLPEFWPMFLLPRRRSDWLERWNLYTEAVTRHRIDPTKTPERIADVRLATRTVYKQYAEAKGKKVWGCKSPSYYCSLPRLSRQFPNARFIVIWRDLGSTCSAILRAGQTSSWFRKPGLMCRAIMGYRRLKLDSARLSSHGVPIHELNYEDLARDPETVMKRICEFLGLAFDPQMTSLVDADRSAIYEGPHHSQVKTVTIRAARSSSTLPTELQDKIGRYLSLWREQSGGTWPTYPNSVAPTLGKPGWMERGYDSVLFGFLRLTDRVIIWAFSFAPLSFLRGYRSLKAAMSARLRPQGARKT